MPINPGSVSRKITRPYSKLTDLCRKSAKSGGALTTFSAVAKALDISPGRITQIFGFSQEVQGTTVLPETIGHVASAFKADGIPCEIDWFFLDYPEFVAELEKATPGQRTRANRVLGDWELREGTVLGDLVELRLHPPRAANEPPDSYYVDATLLFGTAKVDYEPEDEAEEPRTVSIALRDARLAIGSESYRPLPHTMLGEAGRVSEHFKRVSGGLDIVGPAPNGTLDGDPIGDQHLALIAGTNAGDNEFSVSVMAPRGSFVVAEIDPKSDSGEAVPVTLNKDRVLNAFIYSRTAARDDANRAVLARATMKRRAEGDEPE